MHQNFQRALIEILGFVIANLGFAIGFAYYRRRLLKRSKQTISKSRYQANYLKGCFIFALLYLSVFILVSHSGIQCENVSMAARCQCYAIEVTHTPGKFAQSDFAKKVMDQCPNSAYFNKFTNPHQ